MTVEERLGRFRRVRLHEGSIRVRQVHAEEVHLAANPADDPHRLAKIHLSVTRRMRQWHERLTLMRPALPDVILHHRVAAAKTMLVTKPLEYPPGRMSLLHRCRPVRLQDRIDHRQQKGPASASLPASYAYSPAASRTGTSSQPSRGSAPIPAPLPGGCSPQ